jgi:hypothetical protein
LSWCPCISPWRANESSTKRRMEDTEVLSHE